MFILIRREDNDKPDEMINLGPGAFKRAKLSDDAGVTTLGIYFADNARATDYRGQVADQIWAKLLELADYSVSRKKGSVAVDLRNKQAPKEPQPKPQQPKPQQAQQTKQEPVTA